MESSAQRLRLVERHIRARGVRDVRVLAALSSVPRTSAVEPLAATEVAAAEAEHPFAR